MPDVNTDTERSERPARVRRRVPWPAIPRGTEVPRASRSADLRHVLGGRALRALDDFELNPLALGERLEALALDGRMMHEAILLAVLRGDEAETLGVVAQVDLIKLDTERTEHDVRSWSIRLTTGNSTRSSSSTIGLPTLNTKGATARATPLWSTELCASCALLPQGKVSQIPWLRQRAKRHLHRQ